MGTSRPAFAAAGALTAMLVTSMNIETGKAGRGNVAPPTDLPIFALTAPALGHWRNGNTGVEGVWSFEASEPGPNVRGAGASAGRPAAAARHADAGVLRPAGLRSFRRRSSLRFALRRRRPQSGMGRRPRAALVDVRATARARAGAVRGAGRLAARPALHEPGWAGTDAYRPASAQHRPGDAARHAGVRHRRCRSLRGASHAGPRPVRRRRSAGARAVARVRPAWAARQSRRGLGRRWPFPGGEQLFDAGRHPTDVAASRGRGEARL